MIAIQRLMRLHKLMAPAGEGGGGGGGGASGDDKGGEGDGGKTGDDNSGGEKDDDDKSGEGGGDGKGKPSDAEAKLLKDVMKHKNRAAAADAELQRIKGELAKFEGIDPVKVRALLDAQAEEERKKAEAKGDYERLTRQMADAHAADKKKIMDELEAKNAAVGALNAQIAELTVGNAFGASKFLSEDLNLSVNKARVIYGSHFEFKDGKVVGHDKPAGASDRAPLVDASGEPLSFDEALKKIVDADPDKDSLLKSKMRPGAGSSTTPKGSKQDKSGDQKPRTAVEKIQAGLKELAKKQNGR